MSSCAVFPKSLSNKHKSFADKNKSGTALKKPMVTRLESSDGEIHIVFLELSTKENIMRTEELDEAEIRNIMRKEATRPLYLIRTE
jgi:hypothetical protein